MKDDHAVVTVGKKLEKNRIFGICASTGLPQPVCREVFNKLMEHKGGWANEREYQQRIKSSYRPRA